MHILILTTEMAPYAKVGGLGDVVAALPKYLTQLGHTIKILVPLHGCIQPQPHWKAHPKPFPVRLGSGIAYARLWETPLETLSPPTSFCAKSTSGREVQGECRLEPSIDQAQKATVYFLEYDRYFHYPEVYTGPFGSHFNNDERFTFLSRASLDLCYFLDWVPDVIHLHDWPTGLVPVYLNTTEAQGPLKSTATVLTIHNMQHHGMCSKRILEFAGLPEWTFRSDGLEALGNVNLLKGGLYHATKITTVSPQYATEIQTPAYGCGLQEVVRFRAADVIGVLNGIDTDLWSPKADPWIACCFSDEALEGKTACKAALQSHFNLAAEPHTPVFAVVSRLYHQKGIDLLAEALPHLMATMHLQVVLLGNGEKELESTFKDYASRYPGRIGVHIGYNEPLAHQVYAGADFLVLPSRFEPCGLTQMYAMTYGCVPIVRATGGFLDTVEQYVEGKASGSGFIFTDPTAPALYDTIGWACSTYYDRPRDFVQLQLNGMTKDFSWLQSAQKYTEIYRWAASARRSN